MPANVFICNKKATSGHENFSHLIFRQVECVPPPLKKRKMRVLCTDFFDRVLKYLFLKRLHKKGNITILFIKRKKRDKKEPCGSKSVHRLFF